MDKQKECYRIRIKIVPMLFFLIISTSLFAQDITGQWNGVLKVPGTQLRVVFHVNKIPTGFSSTMDSPDQGVKGIAIKETSFENNTLKLIAPNMGLEYIGQLGQDQIIKGEFKQGGQSFLLTLSRGIVKKEILVRPQTPVKPYSYYSEEVAFENKTAGIRLAGTLTLPKKEGVFPAVVLISGSGPQNRDEELFGHQPFLVLADYLTKNGIAVLRYDDRGVAKSGGDFKTATTQDFATDVESALTFLKTRKEINPMKMGLIGHSEGGLIAPIIASTHKDLGFIILMAGPGIPISSLMLLQKEKIERQMGVSEAELAKSQEIFKGAYQLILNATANDAALKIKLNSYFAEKFGLATANKEIDTITDQITTVWMFNFLRMNPSNFLKYVNCPILAINGERDLQVPAKENLQAIKLILEKSGNKKLTIKEFPRLNHLFQESETGAVGEYGKIEQTISPEVLSEILNWISLQIMQ
ncbi:alpha/beta hydrolase [Pedobacter sp. Du54]|uniref:alpha/beta hydrolase family protein n=1 Tax=Pedobacter anseongensis TaxID=3133439 RepID=UPI0030A45350